MEIFKDIFTGAIFKDLLVNVVLPPLVTALAGLAVAVLSKKLKQYGLELTREQEQRIRELATDAILRQDEKAAASFLKGESVAKGGEKLDAAAKELMSKTKLTYAEAVDAVIATLPRTPAGALVSVAGGAKPSPKPFPTAR